MIRHRLVAYGADDVAVAPAFVLRVTPRLDIIGTEYKATFAGYELSVAASHTVRLVVWLFAVSLTRSLSNPTPPVEKN